MRWGTGLYSDGASTTAAELAVKEQSVQRYRNYVVREKSREITEPLIPWTLVYENRSGTVNVSRGTGLCGLCDDGKPRDRRSKRRTWSRALSLSHRKTRPVSHAQKLAAHLEN